MSPAEQFVGNAMLLALPALLLFMFWSWLRGLPKKKPKTRLSKVDCLLFCLVAAFCAFKAWDGHSQGMSHWYIWLILAAFVLFWVIKDWPNGKEPSPDQLKLYSALYCFAAALFAFNAWELHSQSVSEWSLLISPPVALVVRAVMDWPRGKPAR